MNSGLRLALTAGLLATVLPAAGRAQDSSEKQTVESKIRYCKDCHGQQGQGFQGAYPVPRLAGQTVAYLQAKADVILEHKRDNPTADAFVAPALASLSAQKRGEVFEHFASLNPAAAGPGSQDLVPAAEGSMKKASLRTTFWPAPLPRSRRQGLRHGSAPGGPDLSIRREGSLALVHHQQRAGQKKADRQ